MRDKAATAASICVKCIVDGECCGSCLLETGRLGCVWLLVELKVRKLLMMVGTRCFEGLKYSIFESALCAKLLASLVLLMICRTRSVRLRP